MVLAATTAPKGRGENNMVAAIVEQDEIKKISDKMKEMGTQLEIPGFLRDADNILKAQLMVLFGTKIKPMGLKKCGMCGFKDCSAKDQHKNIPCVFNTGDLGIAIGSAAAVAMDNRVDNRIMYSVGIAVMEMGFLGEGIKVCYAFPLSATTKNPFFDRK
ncbi:MAG: ferredoxin [Candidatus Omnitrophica bacterium]|nr:ferredoxin [Candidatus Omnitrophota bacterium]